MGASETLNCPDCLMNRVQIVPLARKIGPGIDTVKHVCPTKGCGYSIITPRRATAGR